MTLTRQSDGSYLAKGGTYYIGTGNQAAIVSTFGKIADTCEYVFFTASPKHERYELVKNLVTSGIRAAASVPHEMMVESLHQNPSQTVLSGIIQFDAA